MGFTPVPSHQSVRFPSNPSRIDRFNSTQFDLLVSYTLAMEDLLLNPDRNPFIII